MSTDPIPLAPLQACIRDLVAWAQSEAVPSVLIGGVAMGGDVLEFAPVNITVIRGEAITGCGRTVTNNVLPRMPDFGLSNVVERLEVETNVVASITLGGIGDKRVETRHVRHISMMWRGLEIRATQVVQP